MAAVTLPHLGGNVLPTALADKIVELPHASACCRISGTRLWRTDVRPPSPSLITDCRRCR